jgi:hypothetical protein
LIIVALSLAACSLLPQATPPPKIAPETLPRTVAVLPFAAEPDKEEQARVLGRMLHGAMGASSSFDLLRPYLVEEKLVRAGLTDPKALADKNPIELAQLLGVEGLLYGQLTHWDRIYLLAYSQVAAGASIRLVDGRSGAVVFQKTEVSRSHEGGVPTNPMGAAMIALRSAWKLREIELVRACDDLVRALVEGMPMPPQNEAGRAPSFGNVVSDGTGRILKAGDVVTVIAQAQPGQIGSFDVVPVSKNTAMEETSPGVYTGHYTVKPGDNAADVFVVARIADRSGRSSEREDVLGRFAVDTTPPTAPGGISVSLREGATELAWTSSPDADVAAYRIYRSASPLTGFAQIGNTETTTFRDPKEGIAYYRVTAVDRAGNESAQGPSAALAVLPSTLPPRVAQDSFLVPANSPYLVEGGVTIDEAATLRILPGVVVRFAPGADGILVKSGRVIAQGTADRRVTFTSASTTPAAGDFKTAVRVVARTNQTSTLEHVVVEYAAMALRVDSGGLEVLNAEIARNRQGGIEVSDTGALKLSASTISGHGAGAGVTLQGFGRGVLRGNRIAENGWAIVNHSANQADARENWWGAPAPDEALFVGDVDRRDPWSSEKGK